MRHGKKYLEKIKLIDNKKLYSPNEGMKLVKEASFANFDETIEVHFNLGIDPRHAEQQLRGTVALPHGTGKSIKIVAIVKGEKVGSLKDSGVDYVGAEDLIEKINGGWFDFDLVVTTPDMMSKVAKLGKVLGVKGLMPSPKNGTVTNDIENAIKEFKAGKIEYRNDKTGIIHLIIGKKSFEEKNLVNNFEVVYDTLMKVKPSKSKGIYMKSISVCSTMGPGVDIEPMKTKWKE